jgi:signal transduction histidine kinase
MTVTNASQGNDSRTFDRLLARYERIVEIGQQLNSMLDHVSLLRRIIAAATELTETESASILLIDPVTGELRFELVGTLNSSDVESIVVPMEGSIAGWVVSHGEPRVIEDVRQDSNFYSNVDDQLKFHTRNLLAVPMRAHNRVIGALEAVNKRTGERFNDDDVKTLSMLATQAAIAIENARLFQQSDFMAEVVHELRSPLAALRTSMSLLLRPELPPDKKSTTILTMQGEIERLIQMTSDFLDLARLESGRVRLNIQRFDLDVLLNECIDIVRQQAADKSIEIQAQIEPFLVEGDRGKIKQVILNLLTNAIKYNREGGSIQVTTYLSIRHDEPFAELSVADTGYGISKESQKKLFQKFYRVEETADVAQGTGLGLAIAKHIIEAHKGMITLESEVGSGSNFFVTLPLSS